MNPSPRFSLGHSNQHLEELQLFEAYNNNDNNMPISTSASKNDHAPIHRHCHSDQYEEKLIPKSAAKTPKINKRIGMSSETWHGDGKPKSTSSSNSKKGDSRNRSHSRRRRTGTKSPDDLDHFHDGHHRDKLHDSAPSILMTMPAPSTTATNSPRQHQHQSQLRSTMCPETPRSPALSSPPPRSASPATPMANNNRSNNKSTTMNDIRAQNRQARSQSPPIKITLAMDRKHQVRLLHRQSEIPDDIPLASPLAIKKSSRGRTSTTSRQSGSSSMKSFMGSTSARRKQQEHPPLNLKELSSSLSSLGNGTSHHSLKSSGSNGSFAIPNLYRYARKGKWEDFIRTLPESTSDDMCFVYKKDGTTALHLAVMSRTGYIDSFRNSNACTSSSSTTTAAAPLDVIEELLANEPQLAMVKCKLNGYTPLTYACLVCNQQYNTEDAAEMVRLFIQHCPDAARIFTDDGLSPVDIHIVSYSHHHKEKEEESSLGKTSTAVLRTLLNYAPDLANLRLADSNGGQMVDGPIELLYKCNMNAFSKAALEEIYDSADDGTIQSDYTVPEKRQQVVDEVKTWWVWTWTVLLLKYGSKAKNKKPGVRFSAVHTCALQVGIPTPIMTTCLYAFPRQIKYPIDDQHSSGNLPLHEICSWPCHQDNVLGGISESMVSQRKVMAINRVLEEYPSAARRSNAKGQYPLEIALKSGTTWDGGVRRLVKANPKALNHPSPVTGLYPFMTAAVVSFESGSAKVSEPSHSPERKELRHVRTIYGVLRSNPKVIELAYDND